MDIVNAKITSIVPPAQDDNFCSQGSWFPKLKTFYPAALRASVTGQLCIEVLTQ